MLSFQPVLFYIVTDDTAWAKETLENIPENIYVVGVQGISTALNITETDQVGKQNLFFWH
jgi:hypothetical protein